MTDDEKLLLSNQICFPVVVASRLITRVYSPFLDELDLTYPQYLVLLALWENDRQTVGELSRRLYLDSNTLTPLLKRMEEKELVYRNRSRQDERSVVISLSETGIGLKEKAVCIPDQIIRSLEGSSVSMEEMLKFRETLGNLIAILDK